MGTYRVTEDNSGHAFLYEFEARDVEDAESFAKELAEGRIQAYRLAVRQTDGSWHQHWSSAARVVSASR